MKVKGADLYTEDIADILGVPLKRALAIHKWIDYHSPLSWTEATERQIELAIEYAVDNM